MRRRLQEGPVTAESNNEKITLKYKGNTQCPLCGGAGEIPGKRGKLVTCKFCDGRKSIQAFDCMECNATGKDYKGGKCFACSGFGVVGKKNAQAIMNRRETVATDSEIKGAYVCKTCKGSGKYFRSRCETCNGDGFIYMVNCIDCKGTGLDSDGSTCSSCKGKKLITHVKEMEFEIAQFSCDELEKTPLNAFKFPAILIVVAALCSRFIMRGEYVGPDTLDSELIKPAINIILLTIVMMFYNCQNYFKGSKNHSHKIRLRLTGVSMMVLLFVAIFIAGPVTGKYSWINEKAKDLINQEQILQEPKCVKVKMHKTDEPAEPSINNRQYDTAYYKKSLKGTAYFKNGDSTKVTLYFSRVKISEKKAEYHYFVKKTKF